MSSNIALSQAPTSYSGLLVAYRALERDHEKLEISNENLVISSDTFTRALYNPNISDVDFRLFCLFIERHPEVLRDIEQRIEIEVGQVRTDPRNGKEIVKKDSTARFFQNWAAAGVWDYESKYDKTLGRRRSFVTPHESILLIEDVDTRSEARKKRAQEEAEKKRKQFKDPRQMLQCPECGSNHILWDATPRCEMCHTVYPTVKNIPASEITIDAEIIEASDDWGFLNAPTEHALPAIPKTPGVQVTQQALASLAPASAPAPAPALPPDPDMLCFKCKRPRRECWYPSEEPGMWALHCLDREATA